jgi:pilus assembly protein CpaF
MTSPFRPLAGVNGHDLEAAAELELRGVLSRRLAAGIAAPVDRDDAASVVEDMIQAALDDHTRRALAAGRPPLTPQAEARVAQALREAFLGLGPLEPLIKDPRNETVNINGCDNVWVHRVDGTREQVAPIADSDEDLIEFLRNLGARVGAHERRFDRGEPELSMQLPGGARLNALMDVTDRVVVSIRLHPLTRVSLADLEQKGEMTCGLRCLLTAAVRARHNIVVSGGPAVGKTTLLRALLHVVPPMERLITIEDAYELALPRDEHPNSYAMQSREPNVEGVGGYDMARSVRSSLRMTPERVVVGEARDGAAVVQMARAMSIGIDGSMCTVHASSSRQALTRLVTYAMEPPASFSRDAAIALIAGAVHLVVHLDISTDGKRVISSVREVVDSDADQIATNEVYRPGPDRRAVPATALRTETLDRLVAAGLDPAVLDRRGW